MAKNENKNKQTNLTTDDWKSFEKDLKSFGYLLPTNDEELEEFEKIYGSTQVMLPEQFKDLDSLRRHSANKKIAEDNAKGKDVAKVAPGSESKENDFFKKMVLAGEIANQLHCEPTFGHKKFVKLQYLCTQVCKMKISSNYSKHAAGPLDPKLMYSIDGYFKKYKWFKVVKRSNYGYKYEPDVNVEKYQKYYNNYYGIYSEQIDRILDLFRKEKSDFCEIVATLFYIWKDFVDNQRIVSETAMIASFYEWNDQKKRFKEQSLVKALAWMRDNEIVPIK